MMGFCSDFPVAVALSDADDFPLGLFGWQEGGLHHRLPGVQHREDLLSENNWSCLVAYQQFEEMLGCSTKHFLKNTWKSSIVEATENV